MNLVKMLVFFGILFSVAFAGQWIFTGDTGIFVPLIIAWGVCALSNLAPVFERVYRLIRKNRPPSDEPLE